MQFWTTDEIFLKINDIEDKRNYLNMVRADGMNRLFLRHKQTGHLYAGKILHADSVNLLKKIHVENEDIKRSLYAHIPSHWEVSRKPLAFIRMDQSSAPFYLEDTIAVLDALKDYDVVDPSLTGMSNTYRVVYVDDYLFVLRDEVSTHFVSIRSFQDEIDTLTIPKNIEVNVLFEMVEDICKEMMLIFDLSDRQNPRDCKTVREIEIDGISMQLVISLSKSGKRTKYPNNSRVVWSRTITAHGYTYPFLCKLWMKS